MLVCRDFDFDDRAIVDWREIVAIIENYAGLKDKNT